MSKSLSRFLLACFCLHFFLFPVTVSAVWKNETEAFKERQFQNPDTEDELSILNAELEMSERKVQEKMDVWQRQQQKLTQEVLSPEPAQAPSTGPEIKSTQPSQSTIAEKVEEKPKMVSPTLAREIPKTHEKPTVPAGTPARTVAAAAPQQPVPEMSPKAQEKGLAEPNTSGDIFKRWEKEDAERFSRLQETSGR